MTEWIDVITGKWPPTYRVLLCYCPKWCSLGYQVAIWDGDRFSYEEQPNEDFSKHVVSWQLIFEAD